MPFAGISIEILTNNEKVISTARWSCRIKWPTKRWNVWRKTPSSSVKMSNELRKVLVKPAHISYHPSSIKGAQYSFHNPFNKCTQCTLYFVWKNITPGPSSETMSWDTVFPLMLVKSVHTLMRSLQSSHHCLGLWWWSMHWQKRGPKWLLGELFDCS